MTFRLSLQGLPSECAVCRCWPSKAVCDACVARFRPLDRRCCLCGLTLAPDFSSGLRTLPDRCMDCLQQPPPLDACQAGVAYAYPWSELITRFKFGAQPQWAAFFASLLLASPAVQALFTDLSSDDWVLPMPLAPERLASRGFNQAWELAKALGGQSGSAGRLDARLLLRPLDTPPQSALNRTARLANVAGAFQVEPLRTKALAGRRVVLIDDVMTSGASVYSAAAVLRSAGAAHITAVVLARTA